MTTPLSSTYAGDVSVTGAWTALETDPAAQLVDVRTAAEWAYVGQPDLSALNRRVHCVSWACFPEMNRNADFVAEVRAALGSDQDIAVYFLCRSGVRSRAAAIAMTEAGYRNCFNISGGFEGDLNAEHHRGEINGWKAAGLPWGQL